jgi:hypothetical protein
MKKVIIIFTCAVFFIFTSCSSLMQGLTDSLYQQKDIALVEDGAPAYLLLVEGLIKSDPKNKGYLLLGIQLFISYSGAFVKDDARKKIFAEKTKEWALSLLRTYSGFAKYEKIVDREKKDAALNDFIKSLGKNDVDSIFWASNAWIMWILNNLDNTDAFLELPIVKSLIDKVYKLNDKYYYGAPHLYYGVFFGAFPKDLGGNLDKAKEEFDIALKLSGDKFLTTKLFYADFYLKPKNDKKGYEKILKEIINTDPDKYPEMRLINIVSQKQAKEMLAKIDEVFFDDISN